MTLVLYSVLQSTAISLIFKIFQVGAMPLDAPWCPFRCCQVLSGLYTEMDTHKCCWHMCDDNTRAILALTHAMCVDISSPLYIFCLSAPFCRSGSNSSWAVPPSQSLWCWMWRGSRGLWKYARSGQRGVSCTAVLLKLDVQWCIVYGCAITAGCTMVYRALLCYYSWMYNGLLCTHCCVLWYIE